MGALPKRKISKQRKGKRRSNIRLDLKNLVSCPKCGSRKLTHQACRTCNQ